MIPVSPNEDKEDLHTVSTGKEDGKISGQEESAEEEVRNVMEDRSALDDENEVDKFLCMPCEDQEGIDHTSHVVSL